MYHNAADQAVRCAVLTGGQHFTSSDAALQLVRVLPELQYPGFAKRFQFLGRSKSREMLRHDGKRKVFRQLC
jgi:molybdopterin biosynthesis enzyme MoaB